MAQPTPAIVAITAAEIIAQVSALVPPSSASILDLISANLPDVIPEHTLDSIQSSDHLVDLEISGTLAHVLNGPIPHKTWLARLKIDLEEVQRSGRTVAAIKHPMLEDLIVPLWALPVWYSIADASDERMLWIKARDWLRPGNHREEDWELVEGARNLMGRMPWGMKAWALHANESDSYIGFLARFLSYSWLGNRDIDIMGICCNAAIVERGRNTTHHVAPAYLGAMIQWIPEWPPEKTRINRDVVEWRDLVIEKGYRYIHIPVNLSNVHWVVYLIDMEDESYSWGLLLVLTYVNAVC